jgi:hypothetical protein
VTQESGWTGPDFDAIAIATSFVNSQVPMKDINQKALMAAAQLCTVPIEDGRVLRATSAIRQAAWACAIAVQDCLSQGNEASRQLVARAAARAADYAVTSESRIAAMRDYRRLVELFGQAPFKDSDPTFDPSGSGPLGAIF